MRDHQIVRRALGWIASVVLSLIAGYQLAWHKEEWATVYADRPLQTIGLLVLVVLALCLMAWAIVSDSRQSTVAGLIAAFAAGAWGLYVLSGINGWFIVASLGVLLVLVALAGMTLFVRRSKGISRIARWLNNRNASHPAGPVVDIDDDDHPVSGSPAPVPHAAAPAPAEVPVSPIVDHSSTPAAPASGTTTS